MSDGRGRKLLTILRYTSYKTSVTELFSPNVNSFEVENPALRNKLSERNGRASRWTCAFWNFPQPLPRLAHVCCHFSFNKFHIPFLLLGADSIKTARSWVLDNSSIS